MKKEKVIERKKSKKSLSSDSRFIFLRVLLSSGKTRNPNFSIVSSKLSSEEFQLFYLPNRKNNEAPQWILLFSP